MRLDKEYLPTKEQGREIYRVLKDEKDYITESKILEYTGIHPITILYTLNQLDIEGLLETKEVEKNRFKFKAK